MGHRSCRWLHPAVFVLTAAFDSLDMETGRAGSASRKAPEHEIDWSAAQERTATQKLSLKQWAQHVLNFHGWRN